MKSLLTKGLNISVTIKNNYAQIIISIGILILCLAIGISFIKGKSTINLSSELPSLKDNSTPMLDEFDKYGWDILCTNHFTSVTNKITSKPKK